MTERNINSARGLLNTADKPLDKEIVTPANLNVPEDRELDDSVDSNNSVLSMSHAGHVKHEDAETMIQNAIDKTSTPIKVTWTDAKFTVMAPDPAAKK